MHKSTLFTLLLLSLGILSKAQDSIPITYSTPSHYYSYGIDELAWRADTQFVDTSLQKHDIYRLNPNRKDHFGYASFSNLAAQKQSLIIQPLLRGNFSGFSNSIKYLQVNPDQIPYYNVRSPYTELFFLSGFKQGQTVGFKHSQNFGPNTNVNADISRSTSLGRYKNEESRYFDILLNGHHRSSNGRYQLKWWYDRVVTRIQENGGLSEPDKFEDNVETDRIVMPINLSNAYGRNKSMNGGFLQVINLGTWVPDTSTSDSNDLILVETRSRWIQGFRYDKDVMVYGDLIENPTYYPEINSDSTFTYDSIYKHHYQLDFAYERDQFNQTVRYGWAGHIDVYNTGIERLSGFGNEVNLSLREKGALSRYYFTYHTFIGGLRDGTHDAHLRTFPLGRKLWRMDLQYLSKTPDILPRYHKTNHTNWSNDFSNEQMFRFNTSLQTGKDGFRIGIEALYFNNKIYFKDSIVQAVQNGQADLIGRFYLSGQLNFGLFFLDNDIAIQVLEGEAFRAPLLTTRQNLYYKDSWFKGAMDVHLGVIFNYFTSYNAPSYAPWIATFYIADEKSIGNYPYLDFYMKYRVRELELFAMVQHLNQGLSGFTYYAAPNHPMADRYLRLGVKWNFFN